jgi:hypothetical protein
MQTPDVGMQFPYRFMLMPKIIDKNRNAGSIFFEDPSKRLPLAALITINGRVDANGPQLLSPRPCAVVKQVGQDQDIGMFAQSVEAFYSAVNCLLPMHFGVEKSVEQIPNLTAFNDRTIMLVAQCFTPITMDKVEMDMMDAIEPVAKRHNHVQQHFVAIGNQQWPGIHNTHASNSCRACTKTVGETPMTAAQATRSGSYASKNDKMAACVLRSITLLRKPSGVRPVSDNNRSARDSSVNAQANAWNAMPDASNVSFVSCMAFA